MTACNLYAMHMNAMIFEWCQQTHNECLCMNIESEEVNKTIKENRECDRFIFALHLLVIFHWKTIDFIKE